MNLLQLLIILKKVRQILIRDINIRSPTQPAMFVNIYLTPRERMFIDLSVRAVIHYIETPLSESSSSYHS